jgi:hypothetical protein
MNTYKRSGNKWNVNELLSLQREYELLEWTVGQIAKKHQRSIEAILFKLESEGLINSWSEARGFDSKKYQQSFTVKNQESDEEMSDEELSDEEMSVDDEVSEYVDDEVSLDEVSLDDVSDVDKLTERVWNLETSVSEIGSMVKEMFDKMVSKNNVKKSKRLPLRKN